MRDSLRSRFILTMLFLAVCLPIAFAEPKKTGESTDKKTKVRVTIGNETTAITQPLGPDGYPDYVAAINQRLSQGVTPENNAMVLIAKAFGPADIPEKMRPEFFKLLGIEALPAEGNYFVPQHEIIRRWREKLIPGAPAEIPESPYDAFASITERPWSAADYPIAAEWLRVNEEPMRLFVEAASRPKYFMPLVALDDSKPPSLTTLTNLDWWLRGATEALSARAMYKLGAGDVESACADLMTIRKLARRFDTEFLIGSLIAEMAEDEAAGVLTAILHHTRTSPDLRKKLKAEWDALPSSATLFDEYGKSEHLFALDVICFAARNGDDKISDLGLELFSDKQLLSEALKEAVQSAVIDWNVALRAINQGYRRLKADMRISDRRQREEALSKLDEELGRLREHAIHPPKQSEQEFAEHSTKVASQRAADILVVQFISAVKRPMVMLQGRADMRRQFVETTFALADYRAANGQYPAKIEELIPKYLAQVPEDYFSKESRPVRYRRQGEAYVLWSVGYNGIDDGGKNVLDALESNALDKEWDDVVFRPARAQKDGAN